MSTAFSRNLREAPRQSTASTLESRFPSRQQLFAKTAPTLAENKIDESYSSVAEYIAIHSDLILEDFMHPLRKSIKGFKRNRHANYYDGARIFHKVKLTSFEEVGTGRYTFTTCYFESGILNNKPVSGLQSENVPSFGQLLLFTRSDFEEHLFLGKVISDKGETEGIRIRLKQFLDSALSMDELRNGTYTMMQADAFFYMYENLLQSLTSLDEYSFPMKKYIISGNQYTKLSPPAYLTSWTKYKIGDVEVPALDHTNWPSHEAVNLDESQYAALKKALTEEVTLIQGPPGTGKTYFGVKLVQVLLDNISVWNPSKMCPLIVVCQSNVALDHFLEELLANCSTDKFVRIGDQCQSEILKPYFLRELACRYVACNRDTVGSRSLRSLLKSIDEIRALLNQVMEGIISFKTFERWGVIDQNVSQKFKSGRHYMEWMGFNVEVDEKKVLANENGFVVLLEDLRKQVEESGRDEEFVKICDLLLKGMKESIPNNSRSHRILSLSPSRAQNKYLCWVDQLCTSLQDKLENQIEELNRQFDNLNYKTRENARYQVLRSNYVIGMTSTAASARRFTLEQLQSPIVVIEEAAEVLEAHVVVSMTKACEHLILLGDHKQLKPCTTTHHLAVDYHLNMSLFERLLRNKIVEGLCLTTQYRMRPEISSLLTPHFYNILDNAPSTEERTNVEGLQSNLFFFHHEKPEQPADDDRGYCNPFEAKMLINLARYLVYVGNPAVDITIISMYSEQRTKLIELRDKDPDLESMEIASVDSFQGKENEIVLVSLVRSNKAGKIGFLKEDNRVCVALSRAKRGMFIMGNMKCLTEPYYQNGMRVQKPVWIHAKQRLEEQNALGTELTLICPKHKSSCRIYDIDHWYEAFCLKCDEERRIEYKNDQVRKSEDDYLYEERGYSDEDCREGDYSEEENGSEEEGEFEEEESEFEEEECEEEEVEGSSEEEDDSEIEGNADEQGGSKEKCDKGGSTASSESLVSSTEDTTSGDPLEAEVSRYLANLSLSDSTASTKDVDRSVTNASFNDSIISTSSEPVSKTSAPSEPVSKSSSSEYVSKTPTSPGAFSKSSSSFSFVPENDSPFSFASEDSPNFNSFNSIPVISSSPFASENITFLDHSGCVSLNSTSSKPVSKTSISSEPVSKSSSSEHISKSSSFFSFVPENYSCVSFALEDSSPPFPVSPNSSPLNSIPMGLNSSPSDLFLSYSDDTWNSSNKETVCRVTEVTNVSKEAEVNNTSNCSDHLAVISSQSARPNHEQIVHNTPKVGCFTGDCTSPDQSNVISATSTLTKSKDLLNVFNGPKVDCRSEDLNSSDQPAVNISMSNEIRLPKDLVQTGLVNTTNGIRTSSDLNVPKSSSSAESSIIPEAKPVNPSCSIH